ncbi:nitrilase family protein [Pleurocapsales cyanobacterium LEGE 10410]|nr:nitrilase family protein [Pleurocapsales cyanobacterium LEGE 10410]
MNKQQNIVKIACIQMKPTVGEKEKNLWRSIQAIAKAATQGAKLIVLPELCNSGYVFKDRNEAWKLSELVPNGATCQAWIELAAKHQIYLVAGIDEREDDRLYNSAVVIGPKGYIGTYRKVHLWNEENSFFEPGNLGFPVFKTEIGRIGVLICYDGWFCESYRLSTLQEADIICIPTNWVPIPGQAENRESMANILMMAAAHTNSVFIAAADRVGVERNQTFIGQSLIVSHTGWPIAGPASPDREEIIYAEANLADAKDKRQWSKYNHIIGDRRTDLYDETLGAKVALVSSMVG